MKVRDGGTETFDLGGHWVGTSQTDIMEMLDELGLEVYPQYIQVMTMTRIKCTYTAPISLQ